MSSRAKPMHIVCKLLGVAPYVFDAKSSKTRFKTSKLGLIYSAVISAFLTWFAICNYKTTRSHLKSGSYVTIGIQWLQFYVNNGFSVLIVIANFLQQWKVVKDSNCPQVFNALFDVETHPKKIPEYGESYRDILYGTAIVVIVIIIHLLTTLSSYFDNEKRIDYYWFPYGILFLLNTLVVLQFLCGVVKVGTDFQALSARLEDSISKRPTVISIHQNTDLIDIEVNKAADEYLQLIDKTNLLITAFSYQLLLCFVAALIIPVSGLYLICKRIIQYSIDSSTLTIYEMREKVYNWWALSCYPLLHSLLLGVIVTVCHWTVNQVNRICQQLLLEKISFHVFHLFTINPSMICSIISTVLTYLIILVQFEISQDIENTIESDALNSSMD